MKKRLLGATIVVAVMLGTFLGGIKIFTLIMTVLALLGLKELLDIKYKETDVRIIKIIAYIMLTIMLISSMVNTDEKLFLLPMLLFMIPIVFYNDKNTYNIMDAVYFIGTIYLMYFTWGSLIQIRNISIYKCIYVFVISFMTDTYAYIGGMLIGRKNLISISPKKTIEGSIIGTIMGVFIGSMFYLATNGDLTIMDVILMSFVLSILSEFGDLTFSAIKRYFGKKDYANLIPGHGGILDRFDSVLFVTLGMAIIMQLF